MNPDLRSSAIRGGVLESKGSLWLPLQPPLPTKPQITLCLLLYAEGSLSPSVWRFLPALPRMPRRRLRQLLQSRLLPRAAIPPNYRDQNCKARATAQSWIGCWPTPVLSRAKPRRGCFASPTRSRRPRAGGRRPEAASSPGTKRPPIKSIYASSSRRAQMESWCPPSASRPR